MCFACCLWPPVLPDLLEVVQEVARVGGSTKHSFEMKVKDVEPVFLLMTQISKLISR